MVLGRVQSVHRYPIKSMAGEDLALSEVSVGGLLGDREFAVRDEKAGEIRGGKKLPRLMLLRASYMDEPTPSSVAPVAITFPDGGKACTHDADVASRLSEWLGREVTLHSRAPASDKEHYRRVVPGASVAGFLARADSLRKMVARLATVGPAGADLRRDFGREPGEPLPDLSVFPAEIFEFVSPLGTYFDAYPIHLITTASLAALRAKSPDAAWDARRFRPNFVIETPPELTGLVESHWGGRTLTIGELVLECTVPTPRCSMVAQPQPELSKDPRILRTIVHDANQCVGVYARVVKGGTVRRGDPVEWHARA
jgi:uncharacterized protein YcbX